MGAKIISLVFNRGPPYTASYLSIQGLKQKIQAPFYISFFLSQRCSMLRPNLSDSVCPTCPNFKRRWWTSGSGSSDIRTSSKTPTGTTSSRWPRCRPSSSDRPSVGWSRPEKTTSKSFKMSHEKNGDSSSRSSSKMASKKLLPTTDLSVSLQKLSYSRKGPNLSNLSLTSSF